MVICISSISVSYIKIPIQLLAVLIAIILFFTISPSRDKFRKMISRLKAVFLLILIIMTFQILFRTGGTEYFSWSILSISSEGITYGISIALRFILIIVIAGLLFNVPYYDYLMAFRAWKFPYELTFLIASVIHFIPIFEKQLAQSKEALQVRGIELNKLPIKSKYHAFVSLLFPLLARAVSNVKYRVISLELKAFRIYPKRTYLHEKKLKWYDYFIQISSILIVIIVWMTY